jgi:outer membrane protein TolC
MNMKPATNLIFRIACAVILANSVLPAAAESTGTESEIVSLDQLIAEMLHNNPELQAARKRWEALQKRPGQEAALPDPEVRLGWASAGAPLPGFGLGSEPTANLGIEISQTIPFPGKRGLRGSAATRMPRLNHSCFRGELNLVSRLKSSFL